MGSNVKNVTCPPEWTFLKELRAGIEGLPPLSTALRGDKGDLIKCVKAESNEREVYINRQAKCPFWQDYQTVVDKIELLCENPEIDDAVAF